MPTIGYFPQVGRTEFGLAARRSAELDPDHGVADFQHRIGDHVPVVIDDRLLAAEDIAAQVIRYVVGQAAQIEDGPVERVIVTHPAAWGSYRTAALTSALRRAGIADVRLLSQAVAAAAVCANRVKSGQPMAVYDLGGRSFEATVLRRAGRSDFVTAGPPGRIDDLGGLDFDQVVFDHVRANVPMADIDPTDPATVAGMAELRAECVRVKEALSGDAVATVALRLPGRRTRIRLTRAEFEDMIRDALAATVDRLAVTVGLAGLRPADLAAIVLVGGSSRIPLVAELLSERFDCPLIPTADPQAAIAVGAAAYAARLASRNAVAVRLAVPSSVPGVTPSPGSRVAALVPPGPVGSASPDAAGASPDAVGASPDAAGADGDRHRVDGPRTGAGPDLLGGVPARPSAGRHRAPEPDGGMRRGRRRLRLRLGFLTAGATVLVAAATLAVTLLAQPASSSPPAAADQSPTTPSGSPGAVGSTLDAAETPAAIAGGSSGEEPDSGHDSRTAPAVGAASSASIRPSASPSTGSSSPPSTVSAATSAVPAASVPTTVSSALESSALTPLGAATAAAGPASPDRSASDAADPGPSPGGGNPEPPAPGPDPAASPSPGSTVAQVPEPPIEETADPPTASSTITPAP